MHQYLLSQAENIETGTSSLSVWLRPTTRLVTGVVARARARLVRGRFRLPRLNGCTSKRFCNCTYTDTCTYGLALSLSFFLSAGRRGRLSRPSGHRPAPPPIVSLSLSLCLSLSIDLSIYHYLSIYIYIYIILSMNMYTHTHTCICMAALLLPQAA